MKIINQTKHNTCLACVLAMMVGESEQYVLDWFGDLGVPHSDEDAFIFLAHHGIYFAVFADFSQTTEDGKGVDISGYDEFSVNFRLSTHKAYMVVDSPTSNDITHAVLWDGEKVLDPLCDKPQELGKYKVQHVYPFITTAKRMVKEVA